MHIEALDVVRQLVEESCDKLAWTDDVPAGVGDLECLTIQRVDNAWTQWVIVYYDDNYILCRDESYNNPMSSRGVRPVSELFGKPVLPIYIHERDAADKLTKLLKKLNVILQ